VGRENPQILMVATRLPSTATSFLHTIQVFE
jgi:hypothetical protein